MGKGLSGGTNAAYGSGNYTPRGGTSQRRGSFKSFIARIPAEYQTVLSEILDSLVFKDELPPSFGKIVTNLGTFTAKTISDTADWDAVLPTDYVKLQSTTPGTQQTGNFDVSGTGIVGECLVVNASAPPSQRTRIYVEEPAAGTVDSPQIMISDKRNSSSNLLAEPGFGVVCGSAPSTPTSFTLFALGPNRSTAGGITGASVFWRCDGADLFISNERASGKITFVTDDINSTAGRRVRINSTQVQLKSTQSIVWSSGDIGAAVDAGIKRLAAGYLDITDGASGNATINALNLTATRPKNIEYLLASVQVNVGSVAATTLYTVPASHSCVVTQLILRSASASFNQATDPIVDVGWDATASNVSPSATYTTPSTTGTLIRLAMAAEQTIGAATNVLKFNVTQAATASTTATVDVWGYLF